MTHRGAQADAVQAQGVNVVAPATEWLRDKDWPGDDIVKLGLCTERLLRLLLLWRPTVAHFFLPGAYLYGGPMALLTRVPVRIMSRRSLNLYQRNWPISRRLEPWLHRRMTAVLGNSDRVVRQLVEEEGCPADRVRRIYNGVDLDRYGRGARVSRDAMRDRLGLPQDAWVGVITANLIPYKGHRDLIHALGGVKDALEGPWAILCVGRSGDLQPDLEALAAEASVGDNVRFLGPRDDVPDVVAAADYALLCSHEEGFSNAILEGMAAGLAMIVTDVGGNAEAVVHGETGLVVPPRDPAALGAAIRELASAPDRARAFGTAGRARAEELFSMEHCVDAYDALYRELIGDQPPPPQTP